jgi:hypothetical protein
MSSLNTVAAGLSEMSTPIHKTARPQKLTQLFIYVCKSQNISIVPALPIALVISEQRAFKECVSCWIELKANTVG